MCLQANTFSEKQKDYLEMIGNCTNKILILAFEERQEM